eukprot:GHVR01073217.1.p1 GENE.GHVR01073217.1~~GHVR01073217.1.p1  ORF type:complete len:377 (-),score=48.20 GHVR01073217.1:305-1435(-)
MPVYTNPIYVNVRRRHFKTIVAMKTDMSGRLQEWGCVEDDDYLGVLKSDATSWRWFSRSKLFEPGTETNERITAGVNDIVINEPGDDVNFRIESDTRENAFYVDGENGNIGFNTPSIPDWDHDNYSAFKMGTGTHAAHIYSGNNDWGGAQNAYYDETDTRWEYIAASRASRWYMDDGVWMVQSAGVGAAADDPITWIDLISGWINEVVINDGQADVDFRVESDTNEYMFYVDAGNERVGIGTGEPLLNLTGNAAFDLAGYGLHVYAAVADSECNLVIEGETPDNGNAPGARLYFVNREGAANDKVISLELWNSGITKFRSWNDDGTILMDDILNLDLGDGGIFMTKLKSGANQGAAGAAANELWVDTADQTIKLGV